MFDVCQQQTEFAIANVCCGQIAFSEEGFNNQGMPSRPRSATKLTNRNRNRRSKGVVARPPEMPGPSETLHLSQWLAARNLKQIEVAKAAKIGRAYMNNLINPKNPAKPPKPSALVMLRISRAMKVSVNELYELPLTKQELTRLRRFQPGTVGTLLDAGN